MADPIIPPFVPSVVISENDLIADTDDKIITIMGEVGTYLQTQTQNASNTINSNVNKIFTATFQGTIGQTTTNLLSEIVTNGQTISVNCLVISANGILGRITEINSPNVIILWLQEITTTSVYKLVIEGTVDTVGELPLAPTDGTTYAVGLVEPRDIYIYDTTNGWVNQGNLKGLDGTSITSVTSNKVGFTTTVTIDGTFDNAPYSFDIEDGNLDAYTKTEVQTLLPVIGFNTTTPTTPTQIGQIAWNVEDGTHESYLGNGVWLQFGQEGLIPVKNNTASTIPNGRICMATGSVGASGKITIDQMDGTVQSNADKIVGMATQDILPNGFGFITTQGKVRGIDTSALTEGQSIYVSTTVIGGITTTPPTTGMKLKVGYVIYSHATIGSILFRTTILDENLYVQKVTSTDNAIPRFNGTDGTLQNSGLIVDDKGNIGVGVTPKNWDIDSNMQAVDFGNNAIMADDTSISTMQNCYFSESTNTFKYSSAGTASMSYLSNGAMIVKSAPTGVADADITFTTLLTVPSSGGIQLPNTTSSDGLTLKWYQEGTFTPTISGSTSAGVGTYTTQTGDYTRNGNRVNFQLHIDISAHTGTGNIRIGGLPFASLLSTPLQLAFVSSLTFTGQLTCRVIGGTSTIYLETISSGAAPSQVAIDTAFSIMISGTYKVA